MRQSQALILQGKWLPALRQMSRSRPARGPWPAANASRTDVPFLAVRPTTVLLVALDVASAPIIRSRWPRLLATRHYGGGSSCQLWGSSRAPEQGPPGLTGEG